MADLMDELENIAFLADLPPNERQFILTHVAQERDIRERQFLFEQGDAVEELFILIEGKVQQWRLDDEQGTRVTLRQILGPGAILGKYDLLFRQPHSVRARALEPCRVAVIDAVSINRLFYTFPQSRTQIAPWARIGRLRTFPFLAALSLTELSFFADACEEEAFHPDDIIYTDSDRADMLYLIDQGQVSLIWPQEQEIWLGNGTAFGFADWESGVPLLSATRSVETGHTATSIGSTDTIKIDRAVFVDMTGRSPEEIGKPLREQRLQTIERLIVFRNLSEELRNQLLGFMSYYHIAEHHHILMQQGEIADSLWILMPKSRATVVVVRDGREYAKSQIQGVTYFNEACLVAEHPSDASVHAEPDSQWMRLHWRDFLIMSRTLGTDLAEQLVVTADIDEAMGRREARERYSWLQDDERLLDLQCRHWFALVPKMIVPILFSIAAIVIWLSLTGVAALSAQWQFVWGIFLLLLVLPIWVWQIADHYNDYLLVTNRRVVRQEKLILISELRQSAFLRQIQNVDSVTTFIGRVLGFGRINIQTAAASGAISFDMVSDPERIGLLILTERDKERIHYQAESKSVIQSILEERLGLTLEMPARVRPADDVEIFMDEVLPFWMQWLEYLRAERHLDWTVADRVIWRKHWFVLVLKLSTPVITTLTALVLLLIAYSPFLLGAPTLTFVTGSALVIPGILIGLFGLGWIGWVYEDWRNDTYEIDDNQVVDVEKKPLFFAETRRTARLDDVENVELRIPSPIHYILNFGDVELQTAAADGDFTFDHVPNPRAVTEEIRRRIENFHRAKELEQAKQRAQELPDWFETYDRLYTNRRGTGS